MADNINRIQSFTVNHNTLSEGIYISRVDRGIVTYDLRTRKPNSGDFMDNSTMHSLEHMFATYVRNSEIADSVLYFGPMGCQTGFYLLVRDADNVEVLEVVKLVLGRIVEHDGEMFGAVRRECGNYRNLDLDCAKREAARYLAVLNSGEWDFKYKGEKI